MMTNEEFLELAKQPIDRDGEFSLYLRNMSSRVIVAGDGCVVCDKSNGESVGKRYRTHTYIRGLDGNPLAEPISDARSFAVRREDEQ